MGTLLRVFRRRPNEREQLGKTLQYLMQAETLEDAQHIIEQHPELLQEDTIAVLDDIIAAHGDDASIAVFQTYRYALLRSREIGTRAAFDEIASTAEPQDPTTSMDLGTILTKLQQPASPEQMPLRIKLINSALQLTTQDSLPELWATLQNDMGISFATTAAGDRAENIERAIAHYQLALEVFTQQSFPAERGETLHNQGLAFCERIAGDRAENLEQAISCFDQALAVLTCQSSPQLWGQVQNSLGVAYYFRIHGQRVENVEQAIVHYQLALQVRTHGASPMDWAMTHNNLGNAYGLRIAGDRAQNLDQALSHYQQAQKVFTSDACPEKWAYIENGLGDVYSVRVWGDRAENQEHAIYHYQQALTVFTPDEFTKNWTSIHESLGTAYYFRIRGARAENLEQAIAHYQYALTIQTREANTTGWAGVQHNLAIAYSERIRGDRAENLEQAIDHFNQALTVFTRHAYPKDWAMAQSNLAGTYSCRIRGLRAENIEQAIVYFQAAQKVFTRHAFPEDWAGIQSNLAAVYSERIEGERAENLEQAIDCCSQAQEVFTQQAFPEKWATSQGNLAAVYRERILGGRAENLEQAIKCCSLAQAVFTRQAFPENWAGIQSNLAAIYTERIEGERAENIEQAINCCSLAQEVFTQQAFPEKWALSQGNLALAYKNRIRGEESENLEQAIAHYYAAQEVFTQQAFPEKWAGLQDSLSTVYHSRIRGERSENLERALAHSQAALDVYTAQTFPEDWATTQLNLGNVYRDRIRGDPAANLERAIACYEQALLVFTQHTYPERWALLQNNLASVFVSRVHGLRAENLEQASICLQRALEVLTLQAYPSKHRQVQHSLGNLCLELQRWPLAVHAFRGALDAGDLLYTAAATPEAREAELREVKGVPSNLAYALAQQAGTDQSLLQEAIVVMERNRARWLAEALALGTGHAAAVPYSVWQQFTLAAERIQQLQFEAQLPDGTPAKRDYLKLASLMSEARSGLSLVVEQIRQYDPNFMPQPDFISTQKMLATVAGAESDAGQTAGVYILTTSLGGLALIVHANGVTPVWLPLTEAILEQLLQGTADQPKFGGWLGAYLNRNANSAAWTTWMEVIDQTTHALWYLVAGPISTTLHSLFGPGQLATPAVTLIPLGLLGLLPLHAAWNIDPAPPTGRCYFLDEFVTTYAPSATSLRHCEERAIVAGTDLNHILAVDEPKPISQGGPLHNSTREVNAAAELFPNQKVLRHQSATRGAVIRALSRAQVSHFSCHGANDWTNPLCSGLLMAYDKRLTVRDFMMANLPNARLAILSACETGLVGIDLPDEAVMLPSALIQAGYAGVIASLWSVADISTAMLMVRFYQCWRTEGMAPAHALRAAQRWVRDTTLQQKAEYFAKFVPGLTSRLAEDTAADFYSAALELQTELDAQSFGQPYWWGAFYFTGV